MIFQKACYLNANKLKFYLASKMNYEYNSLGFLRLYKQEIYWLFLLSTAPVKSPNKSNSCSSTSNDLCYLQSLNVTKALQRLVNKHSLSYIDLF